MKISRTIFRLGIHAPLVAGWLLSMNTGAGAQGTIVGELRNADMSTPPDSAIRFFGFIGNSDNELRLNSCIGAGYESGYWWDDFQNYLSEAPGIAYQYRYFNSLNGQSLILESIIPNNSYEEHNVALTTTEIPGAATDLSASVGAGPQVRLEWAAEDNVTWHIYRRFSSSNGSFFRVDNPTGDLSDPGVNEPTFLDTDVAAGECYHYILVAEAAAETYSPASEILEVDMTSCCQGKVGDVNGVGGDDPTIGDVSLLIDHLFISLTVPACLEEADVNQSGGGTPGPDDISIGDVSLLIDHLFISFVPLPDCPNSTR